MLYSSIWLLFPMIQSQFPVHACYSVVVIPLSFVLWILQIQLVQQLQCQPCKVTTLIILLGPHRDVPGMCNGDFFLFLLLNYKASIVLFSIGNTLLCCPLMLLCINTIKCMNLVTTLHDMDLSTIRNNQELSYYCVMPFQAKGTFCPC